MQLQLKDLSLHYKDKSPLFQNVNLTVNNGDFILIQGPSGSGKSSLLRLLNRLQDPTSGDILIGGRPVTGYEVTELRRKIGYVQQTPIVVETTVQDNLVLPFHFKVADGQAPPSGEDLRKRLDDFLLQDVDLDDEAETLSVGQKQRIALIRTLLSGPEILLCDEPTSALDARSKEIVEGWLERLNLERKIAVVLVSHTDFAPTRVTPRRCLFQEGRLKEVPL